MSLTWNEYQQFYKSKYGSSSKQIVSNNYRKYQHGLKRGYERSLSPRARSPKALNFNKVMENLPSTRHYKQEKLNALKLNDRKSPTRGWGASSPQKGKERHELMNRCGPKAFLDPKNEGYPVMDALRNTNGKCEYRCEGIQSAYNRSKQYHQPTITAKAQHLGEQMCGWKPKSKN